MNSRRTWVVAGTAAIGAIVIAAIGITVVRWSTGSGDDGTTSPSVASTPSESPDPGVTAPGATAGPTGLDDKTGAGGDRSGKAELVDRTIQDGIIQREYLVLRPSWATEGVDLPLVVALHGLATDRWAMVDVADWRGTVQQRGFVAVFPQGLANSWNSGECCIPSSLLGTNDIGFLDSVIAAVQKSEPIDPDRVYVTGFSAGGLMTYRYGCERADRLAGIAPMAGSNLSGCVPGRPLSLLHQHSDPDPVVPYDGGFGVGQLLSSGGLPSVPDSVAKWATAVGCGPSAAPEDVSTGVLLTRWDGCPSGTSVELVRISGIGHEWPRTKNYDGLAETLDFFGIN